MLELSFKFRFVQQGQARGLTAKSGFATEHELILNDEQIKFEDIEDTTTRDERLILALSPTAQLGQKTRKALNENHIIVLHLYKLKANELEKHIDRFSSAKAAERHKQQLIASGKGDLFQTIICPHCYATIDLSEMEKTPYIYCRFCESILNQSREIVSDGDIYRICDECHMFDRVRGYTLFYFYFLLVVYGYSVKRRHVCDTCAIKLSWRALWINLIFILGIPSAIYMQLKARSGRESEFKELAKANALARKGKYQEADRIYNRLLEQYYEHPGLLMNQGLAHLNGRDVAGGLGYLGQSLKGSSNYLPTLQLLHRIKQATANKTSTS